MIMNKIQNFGRIIRHLQSVNDHKVTATSLRYISTFGEGFKYETKSSKNQTKKEENTSKQINELTETFEKCFNVSKNTSQNQTFASLFRNSKFVDLGDPAGKTVVGKIVHIVGDDVYIDFGWKFNCVCPLPAHNKSNYRRGTNVLVKIINLEICTRFLGATKDFTVLEAKCFLKGLANTHHLENFKRKGIKYSTSSSDPQNTDENAQNE